jgi:LCP family protein required for cell wall assembly
MSEETGRGSRAPIARHGRLGRGHPARQALGLIGIVLAVVLVSATSVAAIATWQVFRQGKPAVAFEVRGPSGKATAAPDISAYSGEVNMLVVATDTRTGQGAGFQDAANQAASSGAGNNDTNLLIHINKDHTSMAVISLPRDLEVAFPACKNDKGGTTPASSQAMLNTALDRGGDKLGLSCAAAAVSELTGVQINYGALITFDGVVSMSTAIGGVTVCLATPLVDNNVTPALDLPAGNVPLVGAEAGAFLRSRHGVGFGGDTARISNQQVFMSSMMRQIVNGGVLTNPVKLYGLASTALKNVELSNTLDAATLVKIGVAIRAIGLSNIVFLQYPSVDDPTDPNRLVPDQAGVAVLKRALQSNQRIQLSPGSLGQSAVLAPGASPAPSAPAPAPSATTPAAGATGSASAPASATPSPSSSAAVLPSTATGQDASQQTCTAKK